MKTNIFKLITNKQTSVSSATFVITAIIIITKIIAFFKIRIVAHYFGTSTDLDTFWIANTIPDALFTALSAGMFSSAMIPLLAKKSNQDREKFNETFSRILVFFSLLFAAVTILLILLAPQITDIYIRSLENPKLYNPDMMTKFTRLLAISPLILSLSTVIMAGLQVKRRFFISSLSMPLHTIGTIVGIIVYAQFGNHGTATPIMGMVYGTIIGTIAHLLIQIPGLKAINYSFIFPKPLFGPQIKYLFKQSTPRIFTLINEYIPKFHAIQICLQLGGGAYSAFTYASQLYVIPAGIIGHSLSQALFPKITSLAQDGNKEKISEIVSRALNFILFSTIPISAIILILRFPIVRVFLSTGLFDWEDIVITSWALALFAIAIVFSSLKPVILRVYYAIDDTITPLVVSIIATIQVIVGNILLSNLWSNYPGIDRFKDAIINLTKEQIYDLPSTIFRLLTTRGTSYSAVGGITLSISLALVTEFVLLTLLVRKRIRIPIRFLTREVIKKIIAGIVMTIFLYVFKLVPTIILDTERTLDTLLIIIVNCVVGIIIYLLTLALLKDQSLKDIFTTLKKYFNRFYLIFKEYRK
ncbi:MAG TPA: lipid II flippase MurJ [Candidatus Dojkabacteria bacterium]|nr:lipid II flippase MurJ [Candidatus Dojkabacteria bacterium]HQF36434.1 lipid II flippase MurJ [Candidatus Dojkabacteria bacterium]